MGTNHCITSFSVIFLKSESEVAQPCPTLCDPMDCSLPSSSVHGIFQAIVLEWSVIFFSGDLPDPGIEPSLPHCRETLYRLSHQESTRSIYIGKIRFF